MAFLSEDYTEIKRQIDYADGHFIRCKTREEYSTCFATYEMLCELYKMATGVDLFDLSGPIKLSASIVDERLSSEAINSFYDNFYKNIDRTRVLFKQTFLEGINAYTNHSDYNDGYLGSLPFRNLSCEMEGMEIIYSFLDSCFPEAKPIFDEMLANGRIFKTGANDQYSECEGYSFFNPLEKIGISFLQNQLKTITEVSTFIHEIAHVVDANVLSKKFPKLCSPVVNSLRFDVEVLPCHYQLKFLEYLIRNDIYKEDAKKELYTNLNSLFWHLGNGLSITLANEEEYDKLKFGSITKGDYILGLLDRGQDIMLLEDLIGYDLDCTISIPVTSSYAYGFTLGCGLSDEKTLNTFISSQNEPFFKRLDDGGVTVEVASKQLVKTIELLYN